MYVRQSRRSRVSGALIQVLDADADESEFDPADGRWVTVCVAHGALVHHGRLADARYWASNSPEWCDECAVDAEDAAAAKRQRWEVQAARVTRAGVEPGLRGVRGERGE